MAAHRKEVVASHDWTREAFKQEFGTVCSPTSCTALAPSTTPKFWRDMARQGQIKGVKVGDLWFINSDSLCDALGID